MGNFPQKCPPEVFLLQLHVLARITSYYYRSPSSGLARLTQPSILPLRGVYICRCSQTFAGELQLSCCETRGQFNRGALRAHTFHFPGARTPSQDYLLATSVHNYHFRSPSSLATLVFTVHNCDPLFKASKLLSLCMSIFCL